MVKSIVRIEASAIALESKQISASLKKSISMKQILLIVTIALLMNNINAQDQTKSTDTGRIARTEKKYQELFGAPVVLNATDPELMTILQRFIFGEVFYTGNLDDKTRELITITALATNQTLPQLKAHTNAALNIGVKPIEIREVIYQLAPFIGYPKVLNALDTINSVFKSRGIQLPLQNETTIADSERFEKGKANTISTLWRWHETKYERFAG